MIGNIVVKSQAIYYIQLSQYGPHDTSPALDTQEAVLVGTPLPRFPGFVNMMNLSLQLSVTQRSTRTSSTKNQTYLDLQLVELQLITKAKHSINSVHI